MALRISAMLRRLSPLTGFIIVVVFDSHDARTLYAMNDPSVNNPPMTIICAATLQMRREYQPTTEVHLTTGYRGREQYNPVHEMRSTGVVK
jgi:hypothetical protein